MKQNKQIETIIGSKYAIIGVPTLEDPQFKDRYQRVERESVGRMRSITNHFLGIPQYLSGIASALSIFVVTQPWVAIVSLLSMAPTIFIERVFIKKEYEIDTQTMKLHRSRGMYYYFLARGRAYLESRLLNIHKYLTEKVSYFWDQIISKRRQLYKDWRIWAYIAGIVDDVVSYSLDGLFAFQVIVGQITLGSAQAYIRAIANFKQHVTSLTVDVLGLYENHLYLKDLVWFLGLDNPYYNSIGEKVNTKKGLNIRFENVWFKYPGSENWILKGVNFDINSGVNIAIVGNNGAGKTTMVKLICGFYQPDKGRVTVNGIDVGNLNKSEYWDELAVLFQDFDVYSTSARESIAAGRISKVEDTEAIIRAAKLSDVDEWIKSLPLGYDTPLSRDFEKGVVPSTGQWQRIGIARALFRDPKVLILDEPTSNVDPEAEEEIFFNLLKVGEKKTIIFISHRFSTVRRADQIILLEDGAISEKGTHEELMKLKGKYSELFNLQASSYK